MQNHAWGGQARQGGAGGQNGLAQGAVLGAPLLHEGGVVVFIGISAAHHLDPGFHIPRAGHLNRKAETIKKLWA